MIRSFHLISDTWSEASSVTLTAKIKIIPTRLRSRTVNNQSDQHLYLNFLVNFMSFNRTQLKKIIRLDINFDDKTMSLKVWLVPVAAIARFWRNTNHRWLERSRSFIQLMTKSTQIAVHLSFWIEVNWRIKLLFLKVARVERWRYHELHPNAIWRHAIDFFPSDKLEATFERIENIFPFKISISMSL